MSGKKRRLGKGLDALIPKSNEEVISDQITSEKDTSEKEKVISDEVIKEQMITDKLESETKSVASVSEAKEEVISEKEKLVSAQVISETKTTETLISDKLKVDERVLEKAIEEGKKNPRVVVWSPKSSIVLRILKKTIPEFSISKEASELLEEAIKKKYPEIWKLVEESINE